MSNPTVDFQLAVNEELRRAMAKFGGYPENMERAILVFAEEAGEVVRAGTHYTRRKNTPAERIKWLEELYTELIQCAAMSQMLFQMLQADVAREKEIMKHGK